MLLSVFVLAALSSCGQDSGRAEIRDVTLSSASELAVGVSTCNADLTPHVEESATEVRIEVGYENATDDGCGDVVVVQLMEPLGERAVFDVGASRTIDVIGR